MSDMKKRVDPYAALHLDNQLCFPLYAAARQIMKLYTPHLKSIGLTYTQYITMLVLWEKEQATLRDICEILRLDSGTLTPVIHKLERMGLVERSRNIRDERYVHLAVTEDGWKLREAVLPIPELVSRQLRIPASDAQSLYRILHALIR